jgi:hypothetical protein
MFSSTEADRILKRAAEIEGSEELKPLTHDEIRSIAREAGFGTQAVERAISEAALAAPRPGHPQPVQRSGLVITRISAMRSIPLMLTSEQLMRAIRLFQPYRDGSAHVKLEEDRITWRDRKGLVFTLRSVGGITEIHVYVGKLLIRRGRWMGWVKAAADNLEALILLVDAKVESRHRGADSHTLPRENQD